MGDAASYRRSAETYRYFVYEENGTYYVKDGKTESVVNSSTNPTNMIQWVYDNLTPGRSAPERIVLKGDFVISSTIVYTEKSILDLYGRMKLGNNVNAPMLRTGGVIGSDTSSSRPKQIYFHGGEYDGNKANNTTGGGFSFILCQGCNEVWVDNVFVHDSKGYGIDFAGCQDCGVHASHFKDCDKMGVSWDGDDTNGLKAYNFVLSDTIASGCGVNALYGHGRTDEDIAPFKASYGMTITNCIASSSYVGIYLDERLWGYTCSNNFVTGNGNGVDSGCGIFINGENNGVKYYHARYPVVIGNFCFRNINDGIELSYCSFVKVSENVVLENNWDGISAWGCHDCDFMNNSCLNNSMQIAGNWSGIKLRSNMGETIENGPLDHLYPSYNNRIVGNRCQDTRDSGSRTQQYGIHLYDVCYNNIIKDNWVEYNRTAGIESCDLSHCRDNKGFKTKYGNYEGLHPTGGNGALSNVITNFINGAGTIQKTIDSTGTHITYSTTATSGNTIGGFVPVILERDQNCVFKIKFKHSGGTLTRLYLGFIDTPGPITTLASVLNTKNGAGLWADGQTSANWRLFTNNGATVTNTDSTIAFDGNVHELQIYFDEIDDVVYFVLDNNLLLGNVITATLPAAGTDLGLLWSVETQTTSARTMDIWNMEVIAKG